MLQRPIRKMNRDENEEVHGNFSLDSCLAKTRFSENSEDIRRIAGRTVLDHCCIVGSVAKELIDRMPLFVRAALFPEGSSLIAGAHDMGKVSPSFQEKIYRGTDGYIKNSLSHLSGATPEIEILWGGHAGVSMVAAKAFSVGKYIPEILGKHHGYLPPVSGYSAEDEVFGGEAWQRQRNLLLEQIRQELKQDFPTKLSEVQALVIAGLTTVADWIGSGSCFDDPAIAWRPIIGKAVDEAGYNQPRFIKGLTFRNIFGFEPRPIQKGLIDQVSQTGTYILEAPMGIGKTEAALYAAYSLVASGLATGIYFALPTQLTSNKIHERVNIFLDKILAPDSLNRNSLLLHSKAWLMDHEIGAEGSPGKSWFNAGKRGILAPFAVGTIDQALMAAMNVKHGFVRAFGLSGKVVILDEIHTYDAYTGTILDKLVELLREMHCTVIILSATLTKDRRGSFLGGNRPENLAYPLISAFPQNSNQIFELAVGNSCIKNVNIKPVLERDKALEEALYRAEDGQQVLWIENTVDEAQTTYSILAARAEELRIECGLLHSRFIHFDRQTLEEHWVSRFGKDDPTLRALTGRILVGTQVLEQSLDIDADFLVTQICPTDMLLQRIGRLWRHDSTARPTGASCEVWVLTPEYDAALKHPEDAFGNTAYVYSPYVLLRTMAAWVGIDELILPDDIRRLIESTYQDQNEANEMQRYKKELERCIGTLQTLALQSVATGVRTSSDDHPKTRYGEQDRIEVLLLRSSRADRERNGFFVSLIDGQELFLPRAWPAKLKHKQRELAAVLAGQIVQVPEQRAPSTVSRNSLGWLENYCYLGEENAESFLRVAHVADDGGLKALDGREASDKYRLTYDKRVGYRSVKH
jgi:CRISPR-associated endonuclease/helicase Cas3